MTDPDEKLAASGEKIRQICHDAWQKNLLSGWSGNASIRTTAGILITAKGTAKGFLAEQDLLLLAGDGRILAGSGEPSSESRLHLEIYGENTQCRAILHTHPPFLQALALRIGNLRVPANRKRFLNIALHEARMWRKRLFFARPLPAGSLEVAQNAARTLRGQTEQPLAIWLEKHGLAACAKNLRDALSLTEELEHLAKVQLLGK